MKQQPPLSRFLPLFLFGALLLLLFFPSEALTGAKNGLILWFYQVIPSLLPFLILSGLMVSTGCSDFLSGILSPVLSPLFGCSGSGCYAIIIGLFSGLPVGAKTVAELVTTGRISSKEGTFLLPLCNNAGPFFILGYLCVTLLSIPDFALEFLLILWVSSILSAFLLRPGVLFSRHEYTATEKRRSSRHALSFSFLLLDKAIEQAFSLLLRIGGYIVLFSVLTELLRLLPLSPLLTACLCSLLEITTGTSALSALPLPKHFLIPLTGAFVSLGGLCGIVQTKSALTGSNLPFAHYIRSKLLAALLAATILFLRVR